MRNLFLLALVLTLIGCGSSTGDGATATVRVIHAVNDGSLATVGFDDSTKISGLPFGGISNLISVENGGSNLSFRVAQSPVPVVEDFFNFSPDFDYLVFFAGTRDDGEAFKQLVDQEFPASGEFRIRFTNLATEGRNLNFYILFPGQSAAQGTPIDDRVGFSNFTKYFDVTQGAYSIVATDRRKNNSVVFNTGLLVFDHTQSYSFALLDAPGGGRPFGYVLVAE